MPPYAVVRADLQSDRKTIIDVWRRNLRIGREAEEKFDWQFVANPYGPGRCWLLCAGGTPAGTSALSMRELEICGKIVRAGVAGDFAVDAAHRFAQPALMLQRGVIASIGDNLDLIYGIPNDRAAPIMKRVSYFEAGELHRYAKALRVSPYMERGKTLRKLRPAFGAAADLAYAAVARVSERVGSEFSVRGITAFDERFDELWRCCRGAHPVMEPRDSRFLAWRFARCPLRRYETVALLSRDESRLHGYWIYYIEDESMVGADFLVARAEHMESLLAAACSRARELGLISVSAAFLAPVPIVAAFERFGFRRRTGTPGTGRGLPAARKLMVHRGPEGGSPAPAPWYVTPAEEDNN